LKIIWFEKSYGRKFVTKFDDSKITRIRKNSQF
jgi:hypothetical protein